MDRVVNVKGITNIIVAVRNVGETNPFVAVVQGSTKEFDSLSDLADEDFNTAFRFLVFDTRVNPGLTQVEPVIRTSGEITAIRLRAKRQTPGNDGLMGGYIVAQVQ